MSAAIDALALKYAAPVSALTRAMDKNDRTAFFQALDTLARLREDNLLSELGEVTHDIQSALARFCNNTRLSDLAEKEVPDARLRLAHVLKMTDEAAHRTMDLVEQAYAPAERTSGQLAQLMPLWQSFRAATAPTAAADHAALLQMMDTFLETAHGDAAQVQSNLKEVILAQGYQDLSGQIIRGVMNLIVELEAALVSLVELSRGGSTRPDASAPPASGNAQGYGPVVPQVNDANTVSSQDDIDSLLSDLNI
jgi:chemotaxis protein CheZ